MMTLETLREAVKVGDIVAGIHRAGHKDRFFISTDGNLCKFRSRSRRYGYHVNSMDVDGYTEFIGKPTPLSESAKLKKKYNVIAKYKRLAQQASFTNDWIRKCIALPDFHEWQLDTVTDNFGTPCDPRPKSLYELNITTGTRIDGKVISLSRIAKQYPSYIGRLRTAIQNKETHDYLLSRGKFAGYDISISTKAFDNGDFQAYLSLEFAGCGNGYYYLLINDENFIGYDVD